MNYRKSLKFVPGLIIGLVAITHFSASDAFAYNRNAAANYADGYAMSRNTAYPSFSADCANFASQSIAAGGYPQLRGDGNTGNDNNWFMYKNWWEWWWNYSSSWINASHQYTFQMYHWPGGWLMDVVRGSDARYWY